MSYYTPSALATGQAKLIQMFQANELRFRQPATFREFLNASPIMIPNYDVLRTREDRTVTAYYEKRASRTPGTGRTHNHTGNKGDSGSLTPSWTTYKDPFAISLKQADANVFSWQEMFNNDLKNAAINMVEYQETLATAYLFNNRSSVNSAVVEGSFNSTQYVYEINDVDVDRAVQISKSIMDINKHSGRYIIFCDTIAFNKFEKQANQGAQNSTNLQFQFSGATFVHSIELYALFAALGTPYTLGSWIVVPEGEIAVLPWIPKQNRQGVNTRLSSYSSILNPIVGLDYALHSYETLADDSASGGYTQDVHEEYELSIDLAFTYAPSSTAGSTPMMAFAIVPTVTA